MRTQEEYDELQTAFDALWEENQELLRGDIISTPEVTVETIQPAQPIGFDAAIAMPSRPTK
jgi:hypothetical protein